MVKKCDVVYNYIFKNLLSVKVYKTAPKGVIAAVESSLFFF